MNQHQLFFLSFFFFFRTDSFEKTLMLGKIEAGGEGDGRG